MGIAHRVISKEEWRYIRLFINYKLVKDFTDSMEYEMPLVDDLLTELESYQ